MDASIRVSSVIRQENVKANVIRHGRQDGIRRRIDGRHITNRHRLRHRQRLAGRQRLRRRQNGQVGRVDVHGRRHGVHDGVDDGRREEVEKEEINNIVRR